MNRPPAARRPPSTISGLGPTFGQPAGGTGRDEHAERGRQGGEAGLDRRVGEHLLEVQAEEEERPDEPGAHQGRGEVGAAAVAVEHDPHRQQRVARLQLQDDERDDQQRSRPDEEQRPRLGPRVVGDAGRGVLLRVLGHPREAVDERGQAEGDEDRAGDVVARVPGRPALRHDRDGQHDGEDRDRQVHPEAPAPVGVLGEHAAEQQADGRAATGDRAVDGERLRALLGVGEQHRQQGERRRCEQRAEGALQRAGAEQHGLVLRQPPRAEATAKPPAPTR